MTLFRLAGLIGTLECLIFFIDFDDYLSRHYLNKINFPRAISVRDERAIGWRKRWGWHEG